MSELINLEKQYRNFSARFRQKSIMAGEIGCFDSHYRVWTEVLRIKEPCIIIEDNANFTREAKELLSDVNVDLIKKCGLLSFSQSKFIADIDRPFIISSLKERECFPTMCYGLTAGVARNLIRAAKKIFIPSL